MADSKYDYVRRQTQSRFHECHWPGCGQQVPPALWGCKRHWMMLPKRLRDAIWASYRPGQEKDMKPSKAYLEAARAVQEWIREHEAKQKERSKNNERAKQ